MRSRQIVLEKRRARADGAGREFESLREYATGMNPATSAGPRPRGAASLVTKRLSAGAQPGSVDPCGCRPAAARARSASHTKLDRVGQRPRWRSRRSPWRPGDRVGLLAVRPPGAARVRAGARRRASADASRSARNGRTPSVSTRIMRRRPHRCSLHRNGARSSSGSPMSRRRPACRRSSTAMTDGVAPRGAVRRHAPAGPARPGGGAPRYGGGDMYRVLAAQETLERREALLRGLRQRGALVARSRRRGDVRQR